MINCKNMTVLGAVFTGLLLQSGAFAESRDSLCPLNVDQKVIDAWKKDPKSKLNLKARDNTMRDFLLNADDQKKFNGAVASKLNFLAKPFTFVMSEVKVDLQQKYVVCMFSRESTVRSGAYQFSLRSLL